MESRALSGILREMRLLALAASMAIPSLAAAPVRTIENRYLRVSVDSGAGEITVLDKTARHEWKQSRPAGASRGFRDLAQTPGNSLSFTADLAGRGGRTWPALVKLSLTPAASDLVAEVDMADRSVQLEYVAFLEPWVLDSPSGALAVADYADGHLYPLNLRPLPKNRFTLDNIDMPWVGVCDVDRGFGYALIADTPDDGYIEMQAVPGAQVSAPRLVWTGSHRQFRYPRRAIYHFAAKGGYVALAKRYREYARKLGVLTPFTEKLKQNPNLTRLFGAPDVWGDSTLSFAREAKAAGVEKMLQHTSGSEGVRRGVSAEDMKAINALGYLSSTYDIYADVLPLEAGQEATPHLDRVPDNVVLRADGQRMTAWLTWDKKQYMKRCPALWLDVARLVIPRDLALFPYIGRFIDVITAEGLYECFDQRHPLTRTAKREANVAMLAIRALAGAGGGLRTRPLVGRAAGRLHRRHDERGFRVLAGGPPDQAQDQGRAVRRPVRQQLTPSGTPTPGGVSGTSTAFLCGNWCFTTASSRPGTGATPATSCWPRRPRSRPRRMLSTSCTEPSR